MENSESKIQGEAIHASAVRFLLDGEERDAAIILLSCTLSLDEYSTPSGGSPEFWGIDFYFELKTRRPVYDILCEANNPLTKAIHRAFKAVSPDYLVFGLYEYGIGYYEKQIYFTPKVELSDIPDIEQSWRDELFRIASGEKVDNQGTFIKQENVRSWNGFRFASFAEVHIAKALEKSGVLFLPNCKARFRVGSNGRADCYPDFLICYEGKWGILEVDGPHHNQPFYVSRDRTRDQSLRAYGIFIEHFDSKECEQQPDGVVKRFLDLLMKNR
jgi:hypothetical protein